MLRRNIILEDASSRVSPNLDKLLTSFSGKHKAAMREAEIARRETELRETEARLLGLVLDSKPDPKPGSKADSYENEFPPARRASAQAAVPTASTVCAPPRDALTPPPPPPPVITPPVITPRLGARVAMVIGS